MNKQKSQQGSAHIIVIVILVIALLGTLGFVFWQNYVKVDDSGKVSLVDNEKTTNEESDSGKAAVDNNEYLSISEWGIKGTYTGAHALEYTIADNVFLSFKSSDLTGGCSDFMVAGISRYTGDQLMKDISPFDINTMTTVSEFYAVDNIGTYSGNKHIGDYYYVYVSPQAGCYQNGTTADATALQISNDAHEYFTTIKSL